ncbi:MAG: hypothetical protein LQ340_006456 [Diploschistes diacapsis]|nr:MAG: hypothetical protein LQ340_006456 [Diploschistes diacapsis]
MNPSDHRSQTSASRQSSVRRPRAPTITIDTSAVSPALEASESQQLHPLTPPPPPDSPQRAKPEQDRKKKPAPLSIDDPPMELRRASSFESKDSRPTSPHNVSSPTSKRSGGQPQAFLSVPSGRSRGNSVDSECEPYSPISYGGDTVLPSSASSHSEARHVETAHSNDPLLPDDEALRPDPGTEADFEVQDNCFAFSPGQLNKLLNPKSLAAFHALGGLHGLEKGLRTDRHGGLSVDETVLDGTVSFEKVTKQKDTGSTDTNAAADRLHPPHGASTGAPVYKHANSFSDRKRVFSDNRLPERKSKSFLELAWIAYNDKVLILLTVAAVVSLALGIYQSVQANKGLAKDPGEKVAWVEGVAIVVAIVIVVLVGAANDWQKERQFVKLNRKKEDRLVNVVRSGRSQEISVYDVLVGDVVHLEAGDAIPVDGIFISGHNVNCDESSATGESDLLKKTPADVVFKAIESHESLHKLDPFLISGSQVTEGVGTFLVTSTGVNSSHGKTMLTLQEDPQTTPLQSKLNTLAEYIAKLGLTAGGLLFLATLIRFFVRLNSIGTPDQKGQAFLQLFITAITIIVVAVPEGLPLAVTLALAFATTRMLKDNNLVRHLRACETMGNATTICSDKTGTLTQNKMSVVAGIIGIQAQFGGDMAATDDDATDSPSTAKEMGGPSNRTSDSHPAQTMKVLCEDVKELLKQSIVVNSTAFEAETEGKESFVGSKTETALLSFARDHLGMLSLSEERSDGNIVQQVPFDSKRKCMATVVRTNNNGRYRMFVKGASELMLAQCTRMVKDPLRDLMDAPITTEEIDLLNSTINSYAAKSLRTIGLLYRDFEEWPPKGCTQRAEPKLAEFDKVFREMTFLSVVGIKDPLRDGVPEAVQTCQSAGIFIRMVTGDNMLTAKAIATDCGIFTSGGLIMEGPQFRKLKKSEMDRILPRLQVLARSSPDDKRMLVKRLMELGETVAVTGDGTNDAPALKIADVGFSMGISGTEVAKEASDIILMDDNFASTVKATMWGRAVNDAVKKFLQFQVTVNITAVVLTFISAVASSSESSVLSAVQLLWVNLIMDTLAALALATDPPTLSLLNRRPEPKSAPLITLPMWKMIIGQAIYQLIVTLVLFFVGDGFPMYGDATGTALENLVQGAIFNTFVWMQIFNQYNCRRLDNRLNIFEGVTHNSFFVAIQVIIVAGQVLIMFFGGAAFNLNTRLSGTLWAVSIILGLLSIPVAVLIRFIPDTLVAKLIPTWVFRKKTPSVLVSDEEQQYQWNPALEEIREELMFLKLVRGGRLSVLKYKLQNPRQLLPRSRSGSRSASRSRASSMPGTPNPEQRDDASMNQGPPTPESHRTLQRRRGRSRSNSTFGPAAAMAGIVAGSIAGWSPVERRDGDSFGRFPLQDRTDLEGHQGVDLHPATRPDDPVLANPEGSNKPPSQLAEANPSLPDNARHSNKLSTSG